MILRRETPEDVAQIRIVNERAFETAAEARLVDALRDAADPFLSLVAVEDDRVVGHICFTPVTLERVDGSTLTIAGLAPMAVLPEVQNRGIGSQLVRAGLDACRAHGFEAIVVLGHPEFYPRFGFVPASRHGVRSEYDVPDPVFLFLPFSDRNEWTGLARYHAAFSRVGSS
jgi:putative acetyltransferase